MLYFSVIPLSVKNDEGTKQREEKIKGKKHRGDHKETVKRKDLDNKTQDINQIGDYDSNEVINRSEQKVYTNKIHRAKVEIVPTIRTAKKPCLSSGKE